MPESTERIDALLSAHPMYGDPNRCVGERESVYMFLLDVLSSTTPIAGELRLAAEKASPDKRSRLLASPVLEATVNQAVRDVFAGEVERPARLHAG